jgi:endonuclease-3 related protein
VTDARFARIYERLLERQGHSGWWPGATAFEVCLGAILTQNTSWRNVEKALAVLRDRHLLSYGALRRLPTARLASLIRPSGTFRVKARRVKAFLRFLGGVDGRVEDLAREDPGTLRRRLLSVSGIGPETADSIILYAVGLPVFVVDAYTVRIFVRLGLIEAGSDYASVQRAFSAALRRDAALYNDYHAQIVRLGKDYCRARPLCDRCPLEDLCPRIGVSLSPPSSSARPRSQKRTSGSTGGTDARSCVATASRSRATAACAKAARSSCSSPRT